MRAMLFIEYVSKVNNKHLEVPIVYSIPSSFSFELLRFKNSTSLNILLNSMLDVRSTSKVTFSPLKAPSCSS